MWIGVWMARDEFSVSVKRAVAARAGNVCSRQECRASTSGPGDGAIGIVNVGEAAHITAASRGGPRFDDSITAEQRKGIENAIFLCRKCAKTVDDAAQSFSTGQLRAWKEQAEQAAFRRTGVAALAENLVDKSFSDEELTLLSAAAATKSGEIYVLSSAQTGEFVAVGEEHFFDPEDAAIAAAYIEALQSFQACRPRPLVRHEKGVLYKLTGSGFKLGRAILGR
jgi:hypothetical protein